MKTDPTFASHPEPAGVSEPAQPSDPAPMMEAAVDQTMVVAAEPVVPPAISQEEPQTMVIAAPPASRVTSRATASPPLPPQRPTYIQAAALAGVAVFVVSLLALPRHPSSPVTVESAGATATASAAAPAATVAAPAAAATHVAPTPAKKPVGPKTEKNRLAAAPKPVAPIVAETPVVEAPAEDAAMKAPEPIAPTEPAPQAAGIGASAPVTITGCLEMSVDHDEFRLTDTEGVDAPRSRSWRTGFLKKRSAAVSLVGPADGLPLRTNVGRRVAATGLLTSHDLKISGLRVLGAGCN